MSFITHHFKSFQIDVDQRPSSLKIKGPSIATPSDHNPGDSAFTSQQNVFSDKTSETLTPQARHFIAIPSSS